MLLAALVLWYPYNDERKQILNWILVLSFVFNMNLLIQNDNAQGMWRKWGNSQGSCMHTYIHCQHALAMLMLSSYLLSVFYMYIGDVYITCTACVFYGSAPQHTYNAHSCKLILYTITTLHQSKASIDRVQRHERQLP